MSSQPNQSLIDGIRCLQYLVSSDRAIGCRELARLMGINTTRVNRLLMTMASIGLTMQDEQRRYLPGPGIHALAAQSIRGSALFSHALPLLERYAPKDVVVALGVLWEDQIIYIYHSTPGTQMSQALAGFRMLPAWQSVIGMSLLAAESDEALEARFTPEQWEQLAPHVAQQREKGLVVWRHDDGEVSMAKPLGIHNAAVALAGMWNISNLEIHSRLEQLDTLATRLMKPV
ncbi:IclR family transcriptional regulator domain-containing protein [Cronobacter sakazakii]|uniref:IclR family transcriptional regulator domain-containing protein n=1 Tax=Cronobacter sakazakii TaxID=28141 RepID=UPI00029C7061|nr:IclR family transcriptional regulator [Cronobacter sakazakii]CCK08396.1 Transcriptional regulator, IclR family [Cronobacter sakazakii 696]EKK3984637.1 IclR family transcriptional regulator [Cronobacter sakazakii]ELY2551906.1 IclR family transcriptional regulator [Cronobacter sakazakii]ELY6002848.1 IclR family transcriptional regulator [Cronobacter sakazakii]ELY6402436.1 IclR family transcriptional regulator [Cronobacter sakazakii]